MPSPLQPALPRPPRLNERSVRSAPNSGGTALVTRGASSRLFASLAAEKRRNRRSALSVRSHRSHDGASWSAPADPADPESTAGMPTDSACVSVHQWAQTVSKICAVSAAKTAWSLCSRFVESSLTTWWMTR